METTALNCNQRWYSFVAGSYFHDVRSSYQCLNFPGRSAKAVVVSNVIFNVICEAKQEVPPWSFEETQSSKMVFSIIDPGVGNGAAEAQT